AEKHLALIESEPRNQRDQWTRDPQASEERAIQELLEVELHENPMELGRLVSGGDEGGNDGSCRSACQIPRLETVLLEDGVCAHERDPPDATTLEDSVEHLFLARHAFSHALHCRDRLGGGTLRAFTLCRSSKRDDEHATARAGSDPAPPRGPGS